MPRLIYFPKRDLMVAVASALLLSWTALVGVAQISSPATTNVAPMQSWVATPFLATPAASPAPGTQSYYPPSLQTPAFNQQLTLRPPPIIIRPAAPPDDEEVAPVAPDRSAELGAHLLVVYNKNDPDSGALATYYATRRNISADHVLGISCPITEEISRNDYETTIRAAIDSYLVKKAWIIRHSQQVRVGNRMWDLLISDHNEIWSIVLMRGVPLKIAPDAGPTVSMQSEPELLSNAAAVDSELSLLPVRGLPLGGYVLNPLYDIKGMKQPQHIGPEAALRVILVTRLDGPQPSDVRRMIDDSLYAEKNRLAGQVVIDSRGKTDVKDGYMIGDSWLRHSRDYLNVAGWAVKFDDKEDLIPATDPCNHVALYLGWYTESAMGPWITPPNRFVRGAIAYHLHSFSASTVRSPTANWVGPLIAHGAAATMGTVYEPYLDLTPHLDIFTRHLLAGQPFAAAAYASIRGLSWMVTVVGDPLYTPFKVPLDDALASARAGGPDLAQHYDWLLLQKTHADLASGALPQQVDTLEKQLDLGSATGIGQEGLGDLLGKLEDPTAVPAIEQAYRRAMTLDMEPIDRIRVGLKLAQFYVSHSQDDLAQAEMRQLSELFPEEAARFGVASTLVPTSVPVSPEMAAPVPVAPSAPTPVLPQAPRPPGPPRPH